MDIKGTIQPYPRGMIQTMAAIWGIIMGMREHEVNTMSLAQCSQ